jgi:hypothetical protein
MAGMVRPERTASDGGLSCIELTGVSPVAVSAEAPRSRPRAREEIPSSEWGVKSPRRFVRVDGGEQVRRPSIKRTLQPRDIGIRKETGWPSRSCHGEGNRLHQAMVGAVQDARGVWRRACGHSSMRNRRDPFPAARSGEGGPYKPMAKTDRAGRESEGFIVPLMSAKAGGGKEPCFGYGRVWR